MLQINVAPKATETKGELWPDIPDAQTVAVNAHRDKMIAAALEYAAAGVPVFPVNPATRIPLVLWGTEHTTDPDQIRRWWTQFPIAMIGTPTGQRSGLFVLDLDEKNGASGSASLAELGIVVPSDAPIVHTPSGGTHAVFAWSHDLHNSIGKIGRGIDTRAEGGYVLLAPSKRTIRGKPYSFASGSSITEFVAAARACAIPEPLLAVHPKPPVKNERPRTPSMAADHTSTYGKQKITSLIKGVQKPEGERNDALFSYARTLGGYVAGGEITDEDGWTALDALMDASGLSQAEAERAGERGYKAGMEQPLVSPSRSFKIDIWFEEPTNEGATTALTVVETQLDWVDELNRRHCLVPVGSRSMITSLEPGDTVRFMTYEALNLRYANRKLPGKDGKDGPPLFQAWLQHPRRYSCDDVSFDPNGLPRSVFNLWRGLPSLEGSKTVDAAGDDCRLILTHIRDVICASNKEHADYLIRWLAHIVQRPGEKPGVAVILRGGKGSGKDTLGYYFGKLMPNYYVNASQMKHMVGNFNKHLATCLLFHMEELGWAGNKTNEGLLKALITAPRTLTESKGVDIESGKPSFLRLLATSNEDWIVPATADERRFFVLDVSSAHQQDHPYFAAIAAEMDGVGPAALRRYLEAIDLSAFEVRAFPKTAALTEQKRASLAGFDLFWSHILERDDFFPAADDQSWINAPVVVAKAVFQNAYERWCKERREQPANGNTIAKKLAEFTGLTTDELTTRPRAGDDRRRAYAFPSQGELRTRWDARF